MKNSRRDFLQAVAVSGLASGQVLAARDAGGAEETLGVAAR